MLATTSIGAVWSSSSPDFGIKGVLDRFSQIKPKIIFAADGYCYNGKRFNSLDKLNHIVKNLPTVQKVVIIEYLNEKPDLSNKALSILYKEFIDCDPEPLYFEQLPFDHPLYIMYSSVQADYLNQLSIQQAVPLIQHLKELYFHCDMDRSECIFYFTTCGWMMWNWLVSSLSIGSTIVLFDGSPFYPNSKEMWKLVERLDISIFGTSAKYIDACRRIRYDTIKICRPI